MPDFPLAPVNRVLCTYYPKQKIKTPNYVHILFGEPIHTHTHARIQLVHRHIVIKHTHTQTHTERERDN